MITLIATVDSQWGIGKDEKIPWYEPQNSRWFEELTRGHVLISGRNTYKMFQSHLPTKHHIVLSKYELPRRVSDYLIYASNFVAGVAQAEEYFPNQKIFVIGGDDVYRQALQSKLVEHMYLTRVRGDYKCDRWFPYYELDRACMSLTWFDKSHTPDNLVFEKWQRHGSNNRATENNWASSDS